MKKEFMTDDWQEPLGFLPQAWLELAFEHGVLKGPRKDKSPEALLRTMLMHCACGYAGAIPPGEKGMSGIRRTLSRREFAFMFHQVIAMIFPYQDLRSTLLHWCRIRHKLAEPPRRQRLCREYVQIS